MTIFKPWRTAISLLNPIQHAVLILGFVQTWRQVYAIAHASSGAPMNSAVVHCPCGHIWTWQRPDHYAGNARYPQRCPACDGAGELLPDELKKLPS